MIEVTREDSELWIATINRPDKANSLTKEMLETLTETAIAAQEAKALVITGVGRVFSAGADLDQARAGLATDDVWVNHSLLAVRKLSTTIFGGVQRLFLMPILNA